MQGTVFSLFRFCGARNQTKSKYANGTPWVVDYIESLYRDCEPWPYNWVIEYKGSGKPELYMSTIYVSHEVVRFRVLFLSRQRLCILAKCAQIWSNDKVSLVPNSHSTPILKDHKWFQMQVGSAATKMRVSMVFHDIASLSDYKRLSRHFPHAYVSF